MINGVYNGTQGFVNVDTSQSRVTPNLKGVLDAVEGADLMGLTWKELAKQLNLHHGQASGALSNLHKLGFVFTTKEKRDNCHVYYSSAFNSWYDDHERFDEPVRTKASIVKEAQDKVMKALHVFIECDETRIYFDEVSTENLYWELVKALDNYLEIKQ